jgi:hypothetical protein
VASPFSGRAGRLAGMWAANQAQQGAGLVSDIFANAEGRAGQQLTGAYETGLEAYGDAFPDMMAHLQSGYDNALPNLTQGRDAGIGELRSGLTNAQTTLYDARNQGLNYLNEARTTTGDAYNRATDTLGAAAGAYDPLIQKGMAGYDMLSNSLGLNGAGGNAAARNAFQAGPGYEWQVEQATDAAQRAGNRVGGLYGGNTTDAVTRLGSNLANQEYGNWQKNLAPYQGAALAATTGKAGQLDQLAQTYGQAGTAQANILGKEADISTRAGEIGSGYDRATATDIAGLQSKTGAALSDAIINKGTSEAKLIGDYSSQIANLAGGYGGSMGSLITGTAGNIASAVQAANNTTINAGTQGLLAGQQASGNQWGAILGGLGAGSKILGSSLGGTSLLSGLFK